MDNTHSVGERQSQVNNTISYPHALSPRGNSMVFTLRNINRVHPNLKNKYCHLSQLVSIITLWDVFININTMIKNVEKLYQNSL